jgi:putative Ca2+/H+ antiporter (TMEM165/GDT1 family)
MSNGFYNHQKFVGLTRGLKSLLQTTLQLITLTKKMDWQLLGITFMAVFLSELGDKSQLAAIALGSSCESPLAVFLGTASALLLATLIGVLIGEGTAEVLPASLVKGMAAIGFAVMGLRLLWPKADVPEQSQ